MIDSKRFWQANNVVVVLLHVAGIAAYVLYGFEAPVARLWAIIVTIHILEIPLAFIALQDRAVPWGLTVINTLVFGFTWWVPVRRGIYHA